MSSTQPGTVKGKIVYMAPEQLDEDTTSIDARSDVFAAGVVLHEVITHQLLFKQATEHLTILAVLRGPIRALRETRPEVPASLERVFAQAVSRERATRYQSAQDLQMALEQVILELRRPASSTDLARWIERVLPPLIAGIPSPPQPLDDDNLSHTIVLETPGKR